MTTKGWVNPEDPSLNKRVLNTLCKVRMYPYKIIEICIFIVIFSPLTIKYISLVLPSSNIVSGVHELL